jgi:hypothetical protein
LAIITAGSFASPTTTAIIAGIGRPVGGFVVQPVAIAARAVRI